MAGQRYSTDTARVGIVKGEILKKAMFDEVFSSAGKTLKMDTNAGKTYKVKRFLPYGGVDNQWLAAGGDDEYVAEHLTAEGVTPSADSVTSTIISLQPQQYSCLYSYTNDTAVLFEDDIPMEEVDQAGKRIRLVRELHDYGKLKAGTNAFYGGTGTSTATVNGKITGNLLRKVKRDLQRYHCDPVQEMLGAGPNYATFPVDASWMVYCHTDCEADLYDLPGFIKVAEYGSRKSVHQREIGSWESFRFITAPHLTYYPGGGVVVASGPGLKADDSTNVDVYPMIVMGKECFGQLALRGHSAIEANHIPHTTKDKSDPGGQRGYVWASTWHDGEILNQDWMASIEVCVTDL